MAQLKRDKISLKNKDTRWDRIRKRHCSNISTILKSDAVKKLIEIDYIGKQQQNFLIGNHKPEEDLDPILVMNLRHEMFKKIPRKLPLATVAYQNKLDLCKSHNIAVEEHYIENQLNQFRMHLQKQNILNKLPEKKIHSLLIDNTAIMESLDSTQKHIEDFYTTPMEALKEVHDLFKDELEKDLKFSENEEIMKSFTKETDDLAIEREEQPANKSEDLMVNGAGETKIIEREEFDTINYEREELTANKSKNLVVNGTGETKIIERAEFETTDSQVKYEVKRENERNEENMLEYLDKRMNEMNLHEEVIDLDSAKNYPVQRTPSPLADTDEVLKPLREVVEEHNALHLRCVRFDESKFKREHSTCSNTSDGIDSVISDLAEEALIELQMEEEAKLCGFPEESTSSNKDKNFEHKQDNLSLKGCSLHSCDRMENELIITGKIPEYVKRSIENRQEMSVSIVSTEEDEDETYSYNEQTKIIEQLFKSRAHTNISIMRKYFLKWVHYCTIEKIEREHVDGRADRVKKINIFLDKIRIEKTRLKKCENSTNDLRNEQDQRKHPTAKKDAIGNLKINKKYQTKIKVQQDIIDLQRLKLERQERIIMELKLHKLSEEAREARQELKNELKSVIRSGDPKSKAKAKCLQLIGNLKDDEDDRFDKLQGKALLVPKFLQNMQERALERSVRHEQAKQRRLQQEAEKEAQKMALEEAKRLEDEEHKRLRIEALKEKRRQEKMAKIIKERERQKYLENQRKAQEFYRRLLLKRVGMEGFRRLLQRKSENLKKCEELRRSLYKKTYFQAWFSLHRILKVRRNQKADELYEKILKRKYIYFWLQYVEEERCKFNVAVDYNDLKLTEAMFRKWWAYTQRMKMIEEAKMKQAISHHNWHLKWKVLDCWQRLPQILQLEKETEERRQRWRMKIWELLPDYTPNRDELNFV